MRETKRMPPLLLPAWSNRMVAFEIESMEERMAYSIQKPKKNNERKKERRSRGQMWRHDKARGARGAGRKG